MSATVSIFFFSQGAGSGVIVVAKFNYEPSRDDELELFKGQQVLVLEQSEDAWWRGRNEESGQDGWFPSNYVEPVIIFAGHRDSGNRLDILNFRIKC